ncbi:MAG: transporter substrate-binding domain-containing protein [Zoogloeaceae bacterium]|nr:transporter substrate-binding domain-containing protein [Zoogloeaceae bacterium]
MRAETPSCCLPAVALLFAIVLLAPRSAAAADSLLLTYIEKPPYYFTDAQGEARGFLLERAVRVMAESRIAYRLESRPAARVLHEIRSEKEVTCSLGWFRTLERESFARFSRPLYHDKPSIAVLHAGRPEMALKQARFSDFLAKPGLRVGAVAGYSYGEEFDRQLLALGSRVDRAPTPMSNLAKLVAGRVDLVLANQEELDDLLAQSPEMARQLIQLPLLDPPPGKPRYLMCSRQVSAAQLERIDQAISRAGFDRTK